MRIANINIILLIGAVLGLASMMLAAYVDHGAALYLSSQLLSKVMTAVRYQQMYAVVIVMLGLVLPLQSNMRVKKWLQRSAMIFILGVLLFCCGIYGGLMMGVGQLIYLTPLGGIVLMLGWLCLLSVAL